MLLHCYTGSENWKDHSAKLHVFYSPTAPGVREVHVGVAATDDHAQVTKVRANRLDAKPGFRAECGNWTDAIYEVAEGIVFKVFGYRAGEFGTQRVSANQFIAMREGAAQRRVVLTLSRDPNARYRQVYVEGKFDLLTYDQARLLGAKVMPQFKPYSAPEVLRRAFHFEVLEQELTPRPQLQATEVQVGDRTVQVATRQRRRMMPN